LAKSGHALPLVEETLGRLQTLGYLDDAAFARAWVDSRDRAHPRGTSALRRELVLRGVPDDVIRSVLEGRAGEGSGPTPAGDARPPHTDDAAAGRLLQRRARTLLQEADPRRRRARAYALLARNGFDADACREAVGAWLAAVGERLDEPVEGD
jgi:regulatory protein